ncbi:MAG: hypothetical protein OQJ93_11725 [Ignavibacteriaceae bacterium]|jgi:hypothetical protein|nr:hypothetical protein [Ignavibacteriaceae bacterium]MCW8817037.1 hypothetical protein [Ignavibacteriaceae bacterium]MCW8961446.1 hypothetical protein [Ignavibacteriaceae bacterium]MCW9094834.1 hypothetical protein [Ignavibacteriaceae bacterium]MCW9098048.1 hypothetical protein [Ignavibacteriaceae bacterium]
MKKALISSVILLIILVYFFYPETVITFPPGITAPDQPRQTNLTTKKEWTIEDFKIEALAEYEIKARVLSRNNFSLGIESELSPFDLALGWGPMSDQSVIDKIDISQRNRWYNWYSDNLPIPKKEVSLNSANVHIIPQNETIEEKFEKVYKGSLVEMKGYLVKVTKADGWRWISSLKRDDTGGGSCELFWVEEINVLDK